MARDDKEISYQKDLFDRLKKSVGLRKQEECFTCYLKPIAWWLVDTPNPTLSRFKKAVPLTCVSLKKATPDKAYNCIKDLYMQLRKSAATKSITKFDCVAGLRGFIYPVRQGEKLYGYIGACYSKKDVSPEVLDIFAAFTDTIVREVQKELELSKLYETIRPRAIALSTVHTVHRLISSTLDINELLPRIARLSLQIMRANRCSIKLVDSKRKILLPKATVDLREKTTRLKKVKVGKWAPGKAVKFARPIRGDNYIAVPLIDEDVIGVITLYDKIDKKPFTAFDQEILTTLGEQAVIAIKNAQLYKEQEKLTMGSIKSLATVLDSRAPGTVPRASFLKLAIAIGQEMHLDNGELKSLEYAALLHDAGHVGVPGEVLAKPSSLTGEEYNIVKEHPARSVEIVKHINELKSAGPMILNHHENYDGSGYPSKLRKEQIPMGSRILAVVDAFEAMINERPYRTRKTVHEAIEEITKYSGTQFDPHIIDAFLHIMKKKEIIAMLERES